ncbi:MAG: hypothetical protein WCZ87_10540 [Thiohalobacteraceae bacterium]
MDQNTLLFVATSGPICLIPVRAVRVHPGCLAVALPNRFADVEDTLSLSQAPPAAGAVRIEVSDVEIEKMYNSCVS